MATCVVFENVYGPASRSQISLLTAPPWRAGEATFQAGEYTCPAGTHLIMTIAEINAMPKTGVPDAAVMRDHFFLSFGLVLSCWLLGRMVGSILHLIKGDRNDY